MSRFVFDNHRYYGNLHEKRVMTKPGGTPHIRYASDMGEKPVAKKSPAASAAPKTTPKKLSTSKTGTGGTSSETDSGDKPAAPKTTPKKRSTFKTGGMPNKSGEEDKPGANKSPAASATPKTAWQQHSFVRYEYQEESSIPHLHALIALDGGTMENNFL